MTVRQLRVGTMDVFTYILGCEATKEAVVIDPGGEVDRIIEEARREGLHIKYIFNTHGHWDHTIGNDQLKLLTGASIVRHKEESGADIDIPLMGRTAIHPDEHLAKQKSGKTIEGLPTPGKSVGAMRINLNHVRQESRWNHSGCVSFRYS